MFGDSESNYSPVLGLTILRQVGSSRRREILVVARRPATNRTHPNVVSVPTQRIPAILAQEITKESHLVGNVGATQVYDGTPIRRVSGGRNHQATLYAVEALMAKKFEIGASLVTRQILFSAVLRTVAFGKITYPSETTDDEFEFIAMVNVEVVIEEGSGLIPPETASYTNLKWISLDKFQKMVEGRDAAEAGMNPFQFCVHGLCLTAAYDGLRA